LFWRKPKLPPTRRPALEPDERVLAWAATTRDGTVVVTNRGLWLPDAGPTPAASAAGPDAPGAAEGPGAAGAPEGAGAAGAGVAGSTRLSWDEIHKAAWTGRELVIVPSEVVASLEGYQVTADRPQLVHGLPDPGDVPVQIRARVTKSVAHTSRHGLPGGGSARVVARRRPGVDGVHWTVRLEDGADLDDPVVRELTKELVEAAAAEIGG